MSPEPHILFSPEIEAATASLHQWFRSKLQRVIAEPVRDHTAPKRKKLTGPKSLTPTAPNARPSRPSKPRTRRNHHAVNGRGRGWRKRSDITPEAIMALQATGMSQVQIAAQFGCAYSVVVRKMVAWRKVQRGGAQ